MTQKSKSGFVTFSLPKETVDAIDCFIKNSKNSDQLFQKRPDVIKVALVLFFKKYVGGGMIDEGKCKTG